MQLADERTLQILDTFHVYENNPKEAFDYMTAIWFWAVGILRKIYRVRF